ncbi:AAA family ATPase [Streptomyces phaeolivaceus]|uniref:AAA family ATPase n=2 Tax=Streptomyces phaeolivaceus TaxID=2653200 RepID=A0A5P8K9D5_9ACTN|nr:AAA family ATPase [Streptomyces phaeolivaceus]
MQRTVFAVLAAHGNRVVSRDELVSSVWGTGAPATVMNSVYTYVARLRNSLEPTRSRRGQSDVLISDSLGYMLRIPPDSVDSQRFESALSTARKLRAKNDIPGAVAELEGGLTLWSGIPYEGAVGPFVEGERLRLDELRLVAVEECVEMLLGLRNPESMLGELAELVRRYPLRERLRYLLMRSYADLGHRAEAIMEYHSLRAMLAEAQGIEPGERLRRLYEGILSSDRPRVRPARTEAVSVAASGGVRAATVRQLARDVPDFTGRTAELDCLTELVERSGEAGESGLLLVTGGPGVGKTALAMRLAHALSPRFPDGQLHVDLRGFSGEAGPRSSADALRNLAAAMGQSMPMSTSLDTQAAFRSLVAGQRLLLVLDNAASAEQVRPMLPGTSSCLVIVTSRNGLAGLIARDGGRRIVLDGMPHEDAVRLFGRMVGESFVARNREAVNRLITACDGLPLAMRIAATRINVAISPDHVMAQLGSGDPTDVLRVPGDEASSLDSVFGWSYAGLPAGVAHVFRALGRHDEPEMGLATVARLSGERPRDCRQAMDTLIDANLVREVAPDCYRLNPLIHSYARRLTRTYDRASHQAGQIDQFEAGIRPAATTMIAPSTDNDRLEMTS